MVGHFLKKDRSVHFAAFLLAYELSAASEMFGAVGHLLVLKSVVDVVLMILLLSWDVQLLLLGTSKVLKLSFVHALMQLACALLRAWLVVVLRSLSHLLCVVL